MDELLDLLKQDHEKVLLELSNHARALLRAHLWRGEVFEGCATNEDLMLPGGMTAEDLVLEVFQKVLAQTRAWDKKRYPEIMPVLKEMIRSEISNSFTSEENRKTVIVSVIGEDGEKNFDFEEGLEANHHKLSHATRLLRPQARLEKLWATRSAELDVYVDELFKEVSGDEELNNLLTAVMSGAENAREISAQTGIRVERVYELNRKLGDIAETITKRVTLRRLVAKAQKKGGN